MLLFLLKKANKCVKAFYLRVNILVFWFPSSLFVELCAKQIGYWVQIKS